MKWTQKPAKPCWEQPGRTLHLSSNQKTAVEKPEKLHCWGTINKLGKGSDHGPEQIVFFFLPTGHFFFNFFLHRSFYLNFFSTMSYTCYTWWTDRIFQTHYSCYDWILGNNIDRLWFGSLVGVAPSSLRSRDWPGTQGHFATLHDCRCEPGLWRVGEPCLIKELKKKLYHLKNDDLILLEKMISSLFLFIGHWHY